jgi:hypothetical protein
MAALIRTCQSELLISTTLFLFTQLPSCSYAKEEETQLQWKFVQVDVSEFFPMGVKTTYRAFAQDEVVEIVKSPFPPDTFSGQIIGLKAIKTEVHDYPRDNPNGRPDGMYILKKLPSTLLRPRPFEQGSRRELEKTMSELIFSTKVH